MSNSALDIIKNEKKEKKILNRKASENDFRRNMKLHKN